MISLGSQSQLGIGIAISLRDEFSATSSKINSAMRVMQKQAHTSAMAAAKDYRDMQAGIATGAAAASYGMFRVAEGGMNLQHKVTQAMVLGGKEMKLSSKQLQDMMTGIAHDYARMPNEVGDAMLENIRAGIHENLGQFTKLQTAAAQIVGEQMGGEGGVASVMISAMHSYGFGMEKAEMVANTLAAGANLSKASINGIGESLKYAAFQAHNFNIPFQDLVAILAKMSNAGVEASSAGTRLKNTITYMGINSSILAKKKALDAWHLLGIDPKTIQKMINQGQAIQALDFIGEKSKNLSPGLKAGIYKDLFNLRGSDPVYAALTNTGLSGASLHELLSGINDYGKKGGVLAQAKAATNDPYSDYMRVKGDWEKFKMDYVVAMAPALRGLFSFGMKIAHVMSAIVQNPIGKVLGYVVAIGTPIIAVLAGFRAALLTATFALGNMAKTTAAGGFRGAMATALNAFGMNTLTGRGIQNLRMNAHGRPIAGTGGVTIGGKFYPAGKFVPSSIVGGNFGLGAQMGMAAGSALGTGTGLGIGAKVTSFFGKAAPWLGTIASTGLKFLPVIGQVATIASIGWGIWDMLKKDKKEEEGRDYDIEDKYIKDLSNQIMGYRAANEAPKFAFNKAEYNPRGKTLNQVINLHVDGNLTAVKKLSQNMESQLLSELDFNTTH